MGTEKIDVSFRMLSDKEGVIALFTTGRNFFVENNWVIGKEIFNKTLYDMYGTSEYADPISHFSKPTIVFRDQKKKILDSYCKRFKN